MAYNVATIIQKDPVGTDGRVHCVVAFTGNAGEPEERRDFYVDGSTTALSVRIWAREQVASLNGRKTIADAVTVPFVINLAAPAVTPPTAEQVWLEKARRLVRAKAIGLTNATAVANINTLQADVDATYVAAYLDNV